MYTYRNNFHNTQTQSKFSPASLEEIRYRISAGTATEAERALRKRLHDKLCGNSDCACGDEFGIRNY